MCYAGCIGTQQMRKLKRVGTTWISSWCCTIISTSIRKNLASAVRSRRNLRLRRSSPLWTRRLDARHKKLSLTMLHISRRRRTWRPRVLSGQTCANNVNSVVCRSGCLIRSPRQRSVCELSASSCSETRISAIRWSKHSISKRSVIDTQSWQMQIKMIRLWRRQKLNQSSRKVRIISR